MTAPVRRTAIALVAVLLVAGMASGTIPTSAADPIPNVDPSSVAVVQPPRVDSAGGANALRQRRPMARQLQATEPFPAGCIRANHDGEINDQRIAGKNRYQTSACISWVTFANHGDPNAPDEWKAGAVVLARGDAFADALAGGPLAAHLNAPLLLTKPTELPHDVQGEIVRVLPRGRTVYLLGGRSSISDDIRSELESIGYRTKRLAGANRFDTAIKIAEELPDTSNFFFTTGRNFPDALAAGNAAAGLTFQARLDEEPGTRPVALLLTEDDEMPGNVRDFVLDRGQQFAQWTLVTVGGTADRAAAKAFGAASLARRLAGVNRYETAARVAEAIFLNSAGYVELGVVGITTGLKFPDALGAPDLLAAYPGPLLLTTQDDLPAPTERFLRDHAGGTYLSLWVFGGTSTVSDAVMRTAAAAYWPF